MTYEIKITDSALLDAHEYVQFIRHKKKEPQAADTWFRGLLSAIFSLENLPSRCALIPEAAKFPIELRHLIFHSHRIIYQIDEENKTVNVLRIYHGSRRRLRRADLNIKRR